jgi:hypothetical protein
MCKHHYDVQTAHYDDVQIHVITLVHAVKKVLIKQQDGRGFRENGIVKLCMRFLEEKINI